MLRDRQTCSTWVWSCNEFSTDLSILLGTRRMDYSAKILLCEKRTSFGYRRKSLESVTVERKPWSDRWKILDEDFIYAIREWIFRANNLPFDAYILVSLEQLVWRTCASITRTRIIRWRVLETRVSFGIRLIQRWTDLSLSAYRSVRAEGTELNIARLIKRQKSSIAPRIRDRIGLEMDRAWHF